MVAGRLHLELDMVITVILFETLRQVIMDGERTPAPSAAKYQSTLVTPTRVHNFLDSTSHTGIRVFPFASICHLHERQW
jgi:hypothetical protein